MTNDQGQPYCKTDLAFDTSRLVEELLLAAGVTRRSAPPSQVAHQLKRLSLPVLETLWGALNVKLDPPSDEPLVEGNPFDLSRFA